MEEKPLGPLDSIISCYGYVNAVNALGLLQAENPVALPPSMLSTFDNFIKVVLFSDRIFVHSFWAELFEQDNRMGMQLIPEPSFGGAGLEPHQYFVSNQLFELLPRVESQLAKDKVVANMKGIDPSKWPLCSIKVENKDDHTTIWHEILNYDLIFIEEAIEEYGLNNFKPLFPGENLYLGLRGPQGHEHSLTDVVSKKLRQSVRTTIRKLNQQQKSLAGALTLPENPPIFLQRLLHNNTNQKSLMVNLLTMRDGIYFKKLRKSAAKCHDMLVSNNIEVRLKASEFITSLQETDINEKLDKKKLVERIVGFLKMIVGFQGGLILDPLSQMFKLTYDLNQSFNQRHLFAMKEFSGGKANQKALDDFVQREFNDRLHTHEMESISTFLGLPESGEEWNDLNVHFSVASGTGTSEYGLNGRPAHILRKNVNFTSADLKKINEEFGF